MFQQIAPPSGRAAHFNGLQQLDVVFQHSSHSLLDELFRPPSRLRREVVQLRFLMLRCTSICLLEYLVFHPS